MTAWIENTVEELGYLGVFLLTFAENLFPPIPSEVIMPLAGFVASRGELDLESTIVAGAAGSIVGTSVYYLVGRAVSQRTMDRWIRSYGRWLALKPDDLRSARCWFDRYGRWALFACRFIPGLRTIVSLPAGLNRTPPGVFLAYSGAGVALWTTGLTFAGAALGENYQQVARYLSPVAWTTLMLILTAVALAVYLKRQSI